MKLRELAVFLGVSVSTARNFEQAALRKLGKALLRKYPDLFLNLLR